MFDVDIYGFFMRVWLDKGLENVIVVDYMLLEWGDGSMIIGKSMYN